MYRLFVYSIGRHFSKRKFLVASKMSLFLFSSKRESLYKSTSLLLLPDKDPKLSKTEFTLFIRSMR